ncbi:MAG: beta-glucuronidase, partial [Brevundimonas sp.]
MERRATRREAIGLGLAVSGAAAIKPGAAAAEKKTGEDALEAPSGPVLVAADRRGRLDLSGDWHWSVDPYRDGAEGFHGSAAGLGHRRYDEVDVEAEMRRAPLALYEYDMDQAPTAALPGGWIGHGPELRHYQGLMWYRRAFDWTPRPGRAWLRVGAANYRCAVYLNGAHLGDHEGGFTPFAFEATGKLKPGINHVTLGVDSQHSAVTVPPPVTDWETYGGVTREVA